MLDLYPQADLDVLIGIDPIQGTYTNMPLMKEKLDGKVSLWGGISAAVTVERGSDSEIRAAVQESIQSVGPTGFILSPVDNLTLDEPSTWKNVEILIDEWRKKRVY